jgi:hypothetical protein
MPYPSVLEYATIVKSPEVVESKFSEYGQTIIAKKALQTIAKHFVKKKRK